MDRARCSIAVTLLLAYPLLVYVALDRLGPRARPPGPRARPPAVGHRPPARLAAPTGDVVPGSRPPARRLHGVHRGGARHVLRARPGEPHPGRDLLEQPAARTGVRDRTNRADPARRPRASADGGSLLPAPDPAMDRVLRGERRGRGNARPLGARVVGAMLRARRQLAGRIPARPRIRLPMLEGVADREALELGILAKARDATE